MTQHNFVYRSCYSGKDRKQSATSRITAADLTFVTVRDERGHVISDANSVDVWNTQKGNVRSYPVGKTVARLAGNTPIGQLPDAQQSQLFEETSTRNATLSRFFLKDDNDDRVVLVNDDESQRSRSPIMVRVLRAMTPRSRNHGRNRIFELVKGNYGEVCSDLISRFNFVAAKAKYGFKIWVKISHGSHFLFL